MPHTDTHGWLSSPSLRILATHILQRWCGKPAGVSASSEPPPPPPHATQRIAAVQKARLKSFPLRCECGPSPVPISRHESDRQGLLLPPSPAFPPSLPSSFLSSHSQPSNSNLEGHGPTAQGRQAQGHALAGGLVDPGLLTAYCSHMHRKVEAWSGDGPAGKRSPPPAQSHSSLKLAFSMGLLLRSLHSCSSFPSSREAPWLLLVPSEAAAIPREPQ